MTNLKPGEYRQSGPPSAALIKLQAEMRCKMGEMIKVSDAKQEQARRDIEYIRIHRFV